MSKTRDAGSGIGRGQHGSDVPVIVTRGGRGTYADILIAIAIFGVSVALYAPALRFSFLQWDDQLHLTANPSLQTDSPDRYAYFWTHSYARLYIPLAYNVWGAIYPHAADPSGALTAWPFHLVNVLLHAGCAAAVYVVLRQLRFVAASASIGALLFAVHPLQVESVAWISEMRGLLAGLLSLLSIVAYIAAAHSERSSGHP